MANFGPSKTWTDGEILSHTDLNAALLDIINNVTNNNIDADNIDETDDYTWSGANSFTGGHSIKVLSNAASSIVTGTTLEWDPGDGGQMTDNSSGISLDFKLPDASDNQDVFASIAAICLDDAAGSEDGELSFRVATAGTNTEKMTLSNSALTVTPAITASGGITGSVTSSNATITGGTITGITDIAIADGGTGASTAAAARTNLGLEIGVDVQAYDAELQALSGLTPTDSNIIVGNGSTFVTESGATARTSLGLGSIATQSASAVSITGGSLTGMTSYSGGTISGTTGTFSGAVNANNLVLAASNSYPILLENQDGTTADAAISTYDDANGTLLALGSNFYYNSGAEARFNTSEEASAIVLNRTGVITLRTSDGSNNTVDRFSIGNTGNVAVDTDTLYVDASTDSIGYGTSSPTTFAGYTTLHHKNASGDVVQLAENDNGVIHQIIASGTDTVLIGSRSNHNLKIGTNDTTRLTIDTSGNAGLGVVPSAWSGRTALEIEGASTGYVTSPNGPIAIGSNIYYNGGDKFVGNGYAPLYALSSGNHIWYTSNNNTSGAGAAVTLTQAMTLTNAGLLGVGTASPNGVIHADAASGVDGPIFDSGGTGNTNHALLVRDSGNNQLFRVNNNGNCGIGTSSPVALSNQTSLTVNGTSVGRVDLKAGGGGGGYVYGTGSEFAWAANSGIVSHFYGAASQPIKYTIGSNEVARFTQANGSGGLTLKSDAVQNLIHIGPEGSGAYKEKVLLDGYNNGTVSFRLAHSLPNFIDTGQNFGINTSSPGYTLVVDPVSTLGDGGFLAEFNAVSNGLIIARYNCGSDNDRSGLYFENQGVVNARVWVDDSMNLRIQNSNPTANNSGTVVGTQTSDARLKEVFGPVVSSLDEVLKLNPVRYALKNENRERLGFIAQEVKEVLPQTVYDTMVTHEDDDDTLLAMEYVGIIPVLVNAIKELNNRIAALEAA